MIKLKGKSKFYQCQGCGNNDSRVLLTHHLDRNRKNNSSKNLIILCHNCHFLIHRDNNHFCDKCHNPKVVYREKINNRVFYFCKKCGEKPQYFLGITPEKKLNFLEGLIEV